MHLLFVILGTLAAIATGQIPVAENDIGGISARRSNKQQDFSGTKQRPGPECDLPAKQGTCSGKFNQYYFDSASGKCKIFAYTGCGGNLNNFNSLSECNQRCICSRPVEVGPCNQQRLRYFYNQGTELCQLFIYGGCSGNINNFASAQACDNVCKIEDSVKPRCLKRPEYGHCSNETERYYYDANCGCCQKFKYSGCKGNNNNFASEQQCMNRCLGTQTTTAQSKEDVSTTTSTTTTSTSTSKSTTTGTQPARCSQRRSKGPCNSKIVRYYYDRRTNQCNYFLWGGCGGNANNFRSRRFCVQTCVQ